MRLTRIGLLVGVLSVTAILLVSDASGTRFADQPCPETGAGGIRVCPAATIGRGYEVTLAGDGGCGPALPYQYRLLSGDLPPGVSLSRQGVLAGVPTATGSWDFWVELSDQDPPTASWCAPKQSQREFQIAVGVPPATVGVAYAFSIGGGGSTSWSISSGALPAGLTLDPAAGVVSGTPTVAGAYPVVFTTLAGDGTRTSFSLTLTVYPQLGFATGRLAPVRALRPLELRIRTSGAVGAVALHVVSGRFPVGVRLVGRKAVIRGRPRTSGIFRFTLSAQDSLGRTATRSFTLVVRR